MESTQEHVIMPVHRPPIGLPPIADVTLTSRSFPSNRTRRQAWLRLVHRLPFERPSVIPSFHLLIQDDAIVDNQYVD
jgi:hypothetical protein